MTDEEKIAAAVRAAFEHHQLMPPVSPVIDNRTASAMSAGAGAIDIIFRSLIGVCAAGIGWVIITLPVMKNNLETLKQDVIKIEQNTSDTFTREDFLREVDPLKEEIARANIRLNDRSEFMSQTRDRLTKLEQRSADNMPRMPQ